MATKNSKDKISLDWNGSLHCFGGYWNGASYSGSRASSWSSPPSDVGSGISVRGICDHWKGKQKWLRDIRDHQWLWWVGQVELGIFFSNAGSKFWINYYTTNSESGGSSRGICNHFKGK